MKKILLIIQREYLTRVLKKNFILTSLLAPIILAITSIAIVKINSGVDPDIIVVYDNSGLNLLPRLTSNKNVYFVRATGTSLTESRAAFIRAYPKQNALLYVPSTVTIDNVRGIQLIGKGAMPSKRQSDVQQIVARAISELKMTSSGLTPVDINNIEERVEVIAIDAMRKDEQQNDTTTTTIISYGLSIAVYSFILLYGAQVMRSISEEKANRIMEVMILTVKPFQLMIGKIIGIAGVVLTQFILWVMISWGLTTVLMPIIAHDKQEVAINKPYSIKTHSSLSLSTDSSIIAVDGSNTNNNNISANNSRLNNSFSIWHALNGLPVASILVGFIFFFFGGYLLYSSMFAAIGASVDEQTDAQQFILPVTSPLILSFIISTRVINHGDPNGSLAFWLSMIPFTSPISMVMRLPFGVPIWQLALSSILLCIGFVSMTWISARIYRVGILIHGVKITYKELGKWLFYK